MPALCWTLKPPEVFDPRQTKVIVGAVPEYFRLRNGTLRSLHPTHSVCAVGTLAERLLADHLKDATPCGHHSPFNQITDLDARIVMLGCGLCPNTTMHALEAIAEPNRRRLLHAIKNIDNGKNLVEVPLDMLQ